jgi:hypothetical protein
MGHDLMGTAAEKLGNVEFTDREYLQAITNFVTSRDGNENFRKLANVAAKCSRVYRISIPLLGTFEREERENDGPASAKKKRILKGNKNTDELKRPDKIAAMQKQDKGAEKINSYHVQIERICKKRESEEIPYYELITHPTDFMITVDNAFQVSFLIRDGLIGIRKENGEPIVHLTGAPVASQMFSQSQSTSSKDTIQTVLSINPRKWKESVKRFKVQVPLLVPNLQDSEIYSQATHSQFLY